MQQADIPIYRRLRFKVIALLASIVLLVELVAGFVATNLAENEFRRSTHERFSTTTTMAESFFSMVGQMGFAWVKHFVLEEGLSALVEFGEKDFLTERLVKLRDEASADVLVVLDQNGQIVAHTEDPTLTGESLMSWHMVRKAMHAQEIEVSVVQDLTSLIIYVPGILYDESGTEVRGMVLVGYVINDALINNVKKSSLVDITIVRRRGVMASTFNTVDERLVNNPLNYLDYQSLLVDQDGEKNSFVKMRLNDKDYFVVAHNLQMMDPAMEGSMMLSYPVSELDTIKAELRRQLLIISVVSFLLIVFIGERFSNRLLLPLRRLVSYTEKIESGKQVERQAVASSRDEVGMLAARFNHLLNTIEMKNRELRLYSESLEQKVGERTKELEASYLDLNEKDQGLVRAQQIAHLGSWEWAVEFDQVECSEQLLRIFSAVNDEGSISLAEMLDYIHPDHREWMENIFWNAIIEGRMEKVEYSIVRPDGVERVVVTEAELIPAKSGRLARLAGVTQDITERKEAEKIQVELQRQLHEAQKMQVIGQMTGGVAHEFNNMLATILGNVDLARMDLDPETDKDMVDYLEQISLSGLRARDLVAKMQAFVHVGDAQLQAQALTPLIQASVNSFSSSLPEGVEVTQSLGDELAVMVDPSKFDQVIMNLCLNARDAMADGGKIEIAAKLVKDVKLECGSCHERVEGDYVEVSVSDQGEGIKPEHIEQLFVPFFTTRDVGRGTGMGLSVVHGIMHEHGGHIVVESTYGEGSCFSLLFPVTDTGDDVDS